MGNKWERTTWSDLATLEYGKALRRYESGVFPVYGTNGPIGLTSEPLCKFPSVIIGRKGAYRGIHYSSIPFFVIDTAFYLNPKIDIDTKWAYYQLLTQDINGLDSGSAIPSTSRESFYQLPVMLPSKSTQQAIARVLGALDDKIELLRSMNETLEAMARALFKSWFVDFDPVRRKAEGKPTGLPPEMDSLFPDSFEDSELGEIPKGWKVLPLGEAVEIAGGSTPRTKETSFWDGSFCFATPKDLSTAISPILTRTERRITQEGVDQITSGQLPAGTLLLSSRAPIGYLAIAAVPVSINQGFIAIKKESKISPYFMYSWCKEYMDTIIGHANGTTFLEISKANFKTIKTIVPPPGLIEKYDEYAESYFEFITRNTKELMNLVLLRDSLLPRLISGDLELSDDMISKILEKPT